MLDKKNNTSVTHAENTQRTKQHCCTCKKSFARITDRPQSSFDKRTSFIPITQTDISSFLHYAYGISQQFRVVDRLQETRRTKSKQNVTYPIKQYKRETQATKPPNRPDKQLVTSIIFSTVQDVLVLLYLPCVLVQQISQGCAKKKTHQKTVNINLSSQSPQKEPQDWRQSDNTMLPDVRACDLPAPRHISSQLKIISDLLNVLGKKLGPSYLNKNNYG